MCFRCVHAFTRTHLTPLQRASKCVICLKSLPVCVCVYLHTYTCTCVLYGRCVCMLVCGVILVWATDLTLCVQPVGLWHRGLFHVTQTGRGFEWSGGLEPGLAHCCPLSGAPGSQSTPGRPGLFAPALGKCFTAWGWQPEVAAQREAGPLPTTMVLLRGQQRSPVGGKMVLTATQSGATPKRAEVFGVFRLYSFK